MARVREISEKFFNRGASEKTLREFINDISRSETRNNNIGTKIHVPSDFVISSKDVYRLLTDRGNGRIYDGLKSLEMMSRVISGISKSADSIFDNKIIAFSADDMRNADDAMASRIICSNIGILDVYQFCKAVGSSEVATFDTFVSRISRKIKAGSFKTEDHIQEALVRVKALIRAAINRKSTNE